MASKAAKRISSSAVDWARFAAVIPKAQVDTLRNIKTKHDTFLNKVHQLPENLPKIDFAGYKSRLPDPSMADRFQKAYEALSVPYPVDKDHVMQKVEAEREEQDKAIRQYVATIQKEIDSNKTFISKINTLPKYQELTMESYNYYFPESAFDPKRPTIWPHHEEDQPYVRKEGEESHH